MNQSGFIHPKAIIEPGAQIGAGTRVWAHAHILGGARIGRDCNICDLTFIENDVRLGDRVTVKCGVHMWDGITLEDDVFVGPSVTFSNDDFPRSRKRPTRYLTTVVKRGASIGSNATLLPGIVIGQNAMVGAGAVVTQDVPANAIVVGNPAYIKGYVVSGEGPGAERDGDTTSPRRLDGAMGVRGVQVIRLPLISDLRGSLTFGEIERHLPFTPKRYFVVLDVPNRKVRGEHAHKTLHQFLVCLKGSCTVMVDDGESRAQVVLDTPEQGLCLAAMVWASLFNYSADAVLLVLASDIYDPEDYIRDYDEFLSAIRDGAHV
ncbi:MAG: WxcM-like domain-containing protein [Verrucomicrobia bacterium]|nr:WxcM-like domain-containing protein [Verrucomicrobiota bacterium]